MPTIRPTPRRKTATVNLRLKALANYLDVGGQLWISGRRYLNGNLHISMDCGEELGADGPYAQQFLKTYFHLSDHLPGLQLQSQATNAVVDFHSVSTTNPYMPYLEIDTAKVHAMWFRLTHPGVPARDRLLRAHRRHHGLRLRGNGL